MPPSRIACIQLRAQGETQWSLPRARRLPAQVDQRRELSGKKLDGKAVDWLEKVTDEQYHGK